MREYGRVYIGFWTSSTIRALSDDGRTLALYLLTCPHNTIIGAFRLPAAYACDDLGWDTERFKKGFKTLEEHGFAVYCRRTQWVWIVKFLEWNGPENPNQKKAAEKALLSMPDTCFAERLRNPSPTLTEPEAGTGTGTESKSPSGDSSAAKSADPCPHADIIAAYHDALPQLSRVRDWTPARQQALRSRWREKPDRQTLGWWKEFFAYVAQSDFLTGRSASRPGQAPFECDLEWLVKSANMVKVLEGKYENRSAA